MTNKMGFELREYLIQGSENVRVEGRLFVDTEPCAVLHLEMEPITYEFYPCLHNEKPRFVEVRIEERTDGLQIIYESIVNDAP